MTNRAFVLMACLGLGFVTGCKKSSVVVPPTPQCKASTDCTGGLVCTNGTCSPCDRDRECNRDEICDPVGRRCALKHCFGHDCKINDDCKLGQFCVQGLCLTPAPANTTPGPDDCTVVVCAAGVVCTTGDRCNPVNLVCEADLGCSADTDCAATEACNTTTGECQSRCTADNASQVCGITRVCNNGRCVDCLTDTDCGAGQICNLASNACESPNSCKTDRDCTVPLLCNRTTKACTVKVGPCLSAEDCLPTETCQLQTGKCIPAACQPDRFAPNSTMDTAPEVPIGTIADLTLCLQGNNPGVDYFKVPLRSGDRLDVYVDVDPLLHFDIAVLDPTGSVVSESDYSTVAVVAMDGEYYIRAQTTDAYVTYGLRLSVTRGQPCAANPEGPNFTFDHSTPEVQGDLFGRTICPGEANWYVIAASRGQTVKAELDSTPTDGVINVALFDSDGQKQLAANTTTDAVQKVSTSTFSGAKVYVKVFGADPTVQNTYDLHLLVQ